MIIVESFHQYLSVSDKKYNIDQSPAIKEGLYRIWCGVNRLGDTSAFVNPAGQLLLTRRGKIRIDGVGIVFEFYIGE